MLEPLILSTVLLLIQAQANQLVQQKAAYQQPQGCPDNCECDDNLASTVCSRRNLTVIPSVPVTSLYVYFDRNPFANPSLRADNFSSIPYVRGLYLRGCGIMHFESGTFNDLKFLRELDLSYNRISFIPRGAFANLQLEFLDLGFNPGLRLMPDSFCGAAISRLSLKCCDLDAINVQTFHPLFDSISSLTLSCNDLDTIPAPLVWSPSHLTSLSIADNPRLTCDCNMIWITRRLALQKQMFKIDFTPKGCAPDTSIIVQTAITDDGSATGNCSTDAVMLRNIDYGLCVRSLEAMRMALTGFTTTAMGSQKKQRGKMKTTSVEQTTSSTTTTTSTTQTSTTTSTTSTTSAQSPFQRYTTTPLSKQTTTTVAVEVVDYIVPDEDIVNSYGVETITEVGPTPIATTDSFLRNISMTKCNNSLASNLKDSEISSNPAFQYSRAHMFIACVASATFTFLSAVLCYCSSRICTSWVDDYRQQVEAKQRGEAVSWAKSCSICSSTAGTDQAHQPKASVNFASEDNTGNNNATSSNTVLLPSSIVSSKLAGGNKSIMTRSYPAPHHPYPYHQPECNLRQSCSYPSGDDDEMNHSCSSLCSQQSSPLCIITANKHHQAATNVNSKQTLQVRMAVTK